MAVLKNRRTPPKDGPSSSDSSTGKPSSMHIIEIQQALYLELSRIDDLIERHNRTQKASDNGKKTT